MADEEKIADLIFQKLKDKRGQRSDEDFAVMLAEKLHEHRSPCHELTQDEVFSVKNIVKKHLRLAKTKAGIKIGVGIFIIREIIIAAKENLHWGP